MYIPSGELGITLMLRQTIKERVSLNSKFFKSLNFRIMVILFLVGTIPAVILSAAFLSAYRDQSLARLGSDVTNQCQILATQIGSANYLDDPSNETLTGELMQLATLYDGRILIIDQNFQILVDTYALEEGRTMLAEEVIKCFKGESTSHYVSGRFIEMTVPVTGSGEDKTIIGVILASASTDSMNARLEDLRNFADIWLAVGSICVMALAFLLSNWLVKPLRHMNKFIGDLVEGALDGDLDIHDCTETENISNTFNSLLAKLRLMEESRQEFVSNVSHELKTPLASMKVLADSLLVQEGAPVELYQEFMQDIAEEIDRENTIISDLLTLVKTDRKVTKPNVEVTNVNEFLEQILKRLRPIAEKANIEMVFESNRSVSAEIDVTRLSLAFSNLVENAIKYNHENGWVRVSLDADHKFFYVKVSDSGMGIPEEALDYIFERFYRVDKSHSREIGGTGLGLAITRSAVVAHRGAIRVQSTVEEGTVFTVRIPLRYIT
ncbi:MAG: cell wall metabolism sensor histidine kinase WalK [Lachnospiraceae bacterium]|nr:cell wall metabolism sensor histidine kinase WalK [Lachnospiraceae bacterium]